MQYLQKKARSAGSRSGRSQRLALRRHTKGHPLAHSEHRIIAAPDTSVRSHSSQVIS